MTAFGVVLFYTTSAVLQAEKLLRKTGLSVKLIPTPRQFSSDCGIALRFDWQNHETIIQAGKTGKIEFAAVHSLDESI